MKIISDLREMDRLYFGNRSGHPSALSMALALLTGFTPMDFARDYYAKQNQKRMADALERHRNK